MPAGFSPAARGSDVYFEAMNVASPHSAITSAHCLVGVGYTDTLILRGARGLCEMDEHGNNCFNRWPKGVTPNPAVAF